MSRIFMVIVAVGTIFCASCSKDNAVPTVSGTINGVPATALYGSSNKPADFILLSTDPAHKEISYNGTAYSYYYISPDSNIFINISSVNIQRAYLTTSASKTTLTFYASSQSIFSSVMYSSK